MSVHNLRVYAAWDATPADVMLGESITWTDISGDVRWSDGVAFRRGRNDHASQVAAGLADFTLNNDTGDYTPGTVSLRTPIQVRYEYPGVYDSPGQYDAPLEYDEDASSINVWTGTVDEWRLAWTGGHRAATAVTLGDMYTHAARKQLHALPLQVVLSNDPVWCFPLDESSDVVIAADRSGNPAVTATLTQHRNGASGDPTLEFGQGYSPGSDAGESTVAVFVPHDSTNSYDLRSSAQLPGLGVDDLKRNVIECMILPTTITRKMVAVRFERGDQLVELGVTATGKAYATLCGETFTSTSTISTSDWTHIAVSWQPVENSDHFTSAQLWVNGSSEDAMAPLTVAAGYPGRSYGNLTIGSDRTASSWDGNIANVAAWQASVGSQASLIAQNAGGRDGWTGDGAVERFYRVARAAGLSDHTPSGGASVTGQTTMGPLATKGLKAMQAFDACADAEAAPWWVDANGHLKMQSRYTRQAATVAFTLPRQTLARDTGLSLTDEYLINHVTATRPGGAENIIRKNTPSIQAHGEYPATLDLAVEDDTQLIALTEALSNLDAQPTPRSDAIVTDLITAEADLNLPAILASDIGTRFTVTDLPATAPTTTLDLLVEGVSDQVTRSAWVRSINVSRAERYTAWILGTGTLDETTILGF